MTLTFSKIIFRADSEYIYISYFNQTFRSVNNEIIKDTLRVQCSDFPFGKIHS